MAQLLNLIRERVAYIESMVQMTDASTAAEAMRNSKQVILNRINTTAVLSSTDATACLRALRASSFNVVDRNDLATGINQRMARTGTAYADRQGTQSCLKLHHYLGMHHWHDLSNPNTWWSAKLELLVAILMDLGLTHPSPVTITHIVTMTTIAVARGMDLHKINPLDIYGKAQELKTRLRSCRIRSRLPHEGVVINYPNTARELLEANEIVYNHFYKVGTEQEFTAAPCPINETALAVLRSRLPTRSTHTAIASLTNRVMPRSFSRSMLSFLAPQPRDEEQNLLPGLTFFNTKQGANNSGIKMNEGSLAIEDQGYAIEDKPREEHPSLGTWGQSGQHDTASSNTIGANVTPHSIESMAQQVQDVMTSTAKAKPKGKAKGHPKGKPKAKAKPKGKPVKKTITKTPSTSPCPIIKRPAGNFKATFPGVPNKPEAPRDIGNNMRLFTDVGSGAWRVKCDGRANKTFTWKTDPKGAWERLCNYVSAG